MHICTLAISVLMLALPSFAHAQFWTSPDGFLTITPPDANTFQMMPTPPPPFVGLWVSSDETMKFGVMKMQVPPTVKLIQSSVEEGLAEEVGGKVTRLPTREVSGHEVWTMTAQGQFVEITQAIVRLDSVAYKVMAATVGANANIDLVNQFIGSLSIVEPSVSQLPKQPAARPDQDPEGGADPHSLSKTIGGAGALLGIGLLVYFVVRGKKNRQP